MSDVVAERPPPPTSPDERASQTRIEQLRCRYLDVRHLTEALAEPLSPEDQTVQSMPDVSPTKWHRAHVSWFFETFLVQPNLAGYEPLHQRFAYLFNSYYVAAGPRYPRPQRGLVTRPGAAEVGEYRRHVDAAMARLFDQPLTEGVADLVELGLHHEQQHQELLLMDIKHVLSHNPTDPVYRPNPPASAGSVDGAGPRRWVDHPGGIVEIGHGGGGFAYDNETPRHRVFLEPFELAAAPVTNGDWLAFIADGGYERPELWLSDGWATVCEEGWQSPLYWRREDDGSWSSFTLGGRRPVAPAEPVCHVSYYEADAFARWADARLPTEGEWEAVAAQLPVEGRFLDLGLLHPAPASARGPGPVQLYGDVWEWTASAYLPYPGYRPAEGAVGEYNGKFMVNQWVLRGGCCATPPGHLRPTYRNFFPTHSRWTFSGVRLARSIDVDR